MQHFPKERAVLLLVVPSLILVAFMLLVTTNTTTNVSAVETEGVGVYWDSNCTDRVSSIDWGTLTPGSVKSIVVYIRNEAEEPIYLIISTTNWDPSKASDYITLRWDYTVRRIDPGEVHQTNLKLSISPHIEEISNFSFDIGLTGSQRLPGDVDGDGDVDVSDQRLLQLAMFSDPEEPSWDPNADFDLDGDVDISDYRIQLLYLFESW